MRKSFVLHIDSLIILNKMPDDIAGKFIKVIYQYNIDGTLPKMDFGLEMAVTPFINQFIRDFEKYEQVSEKRKEAGSKGGKQKVANGSNSEQTLANLADKKSNSNSNSDSDKKKRVGVFVAPTLEMVCLYFSENGYTEVSAKKAFDYYEAGDWKDSKGKQVKNWKQKMQGVWFKDEHKVTLKVSEPIKPPSEKDFWTDAEYQKALAKYNQSL